jgi:predicted hydrocarbon binding protein
VSKTAQPQLRLKGNVYARPDYFTTDVSKGVTRTPSGTRMCTLTSDFLLGFRDALVYECGGAFRSVMKSCGKRWGKTFIARFEKEMSAMYQTPLKELPTGVVHTCLADAFAYHGWGKLSLDLGLADSGLAVVTLSDSVMPSLVRESDRPVDHLMTGLLAAVFSHFAGSVLDCVQTECPTRGAQASRFILALPEAIARIESWIEAAPSETPLSHEAIVQKLTRPFAEPTNAAHGVSEPVVAV